MLGILNAHEALPVILDERHHVFLLTVIQVEFARGAHKNQGIEVVNNPCETLPTLRVSLTCPVKP